MPFVIASSGSPFAVASSGRHLLYSVVCYCSLAMCSGRQVGRGLWEDRTGRQKGAESLEGNVQRKPTPWASGNSVLGDLFPRRPVAEWVEPELAGGGLILVASLLCKTPNLGGQVVGAGREGGRVGCESRVGGCVFVRWAVRVSGQVGGL